MRQGFNSASALSTITFLLIFAVAFVLVKFLGANVVETQEAPAKGGRSRDRIAPRSSTPEQRSAATAPYGSPSRSRIYIGVAIILVWGLAPFYWMVVTAFRDPDYTFDTTPWPTHVTLENFRTRSRRAAGNNFARASSTA